MQLAYVTIKVQNLEWFWNLKKKWNLNGFQQQEIFCCHRVKWLQEFENLFWLFRIGRKLRVLSFFAEKQRELARKGSLKNNNAVGSPVNQQPKKNNVMARTRWENWSTFVRVHGLTVRSLINRGQLSTVLQDEVASVSEGLEIIWSAQKFDKVEVGHFVAHLVDELYTW